MTLRSKVYQALHPTGGLTPLSLGIIVFILFSTGIAILETEDEIAQLYDFEFRTLEIFFGVVFALEYLFRLWCAPESGDTRWRYATRPAAIFDLLVVLGTLLPFIAPNVMILRLARVLRMLRLAKIGRYSSAFDMMARAIRSRASHLWVTLVMALLFLTISSTLMYWIEGAAPPEDFGSIPRAMWWATVTMTSVGYGDIVPLTPIGKLFGGIISISGVALIAIPTGVLAASFSDELIKENS